MNRILLTVAFGAAVLGANLLTDRFGIVEVGFGLVATAGTFAAGAALLIRDALQRYAGRTWALVAICVGGALTWALTDPFLALASVTAFMVAELVDMGVYTYATHRWGWDRSVFVSNAVSAPIDSIVFLWIAPFPLNLLAVAGQIVGKLVWATLVPLALVHVVSREPN